MIALLDSQWYAVVLLGVCVGWFLADFTKAAAPKSREDAHAREGTGS